jgi:hypothetical protein
MRRVDELKAAGESSMKNMCAGVQWQLNRWVRSGDLEKLEIGSEDAVSVESESKKKKNKKEKKKEKADSIQDVVASASVSDTNRHVMISYNSASREVCLGIKKHLESVGYKIWIDVESIHGSGM